MRTGDRATGISIQQQTSQLSAMSIFLFLFLSPLWKWWHCGGARKNNFWGLRQASELGVNSCTTISRYFIYSFSSQCRATTALKLVATGSGDHPATQPEDFHNQLLSSDLPFVVHWSIRILLAFVVGWNAYKMHFPAPRWRCGRWSLRHFLPLCIKDKWIFWFLLSAVQ